MFCCFLVRLGVGFIGFVLGGSYIGVLEMG